MRYLRLTHHILVHNASHIISMSILLGARHEQDLTKRADRTDYVFHGIRFRPIGY